MYLAKIASLEEQIAILERKYKNLRTRRNLEVEGYKVDMEQIRKKIRIYDEYLYRVKRLIGKDPERAVELARNQELDVNPIREKLEDMEAKLKDREEIHHERELQIGGEENGEEYGESNREGNEEEIHRQQDEVERKEELRDPE
eukprot:TRINITY_DN3117_c0_g1_i12.p2 TRINITY_DN3117_c0_g1~~TRINITY_DN3117_c0_g1_i12.p2  ORF type:complete len:144 (-),score=48.97 TRINITY_DN3117_c0_g1_i12:88-519(-)